MKNTTNIIWSQTAHFSPFIPFDIKKFNWKVSWRWADLHLIFTLSYSSKVEGGVKKKMRVTFRFDESYVPPRSWTNSDPQISNVKFKSVTALSLERCSIHLSLSFAQFVAWHVIWDTFTDCCSLQEKLNRTGLSKKSCSVFFNVVL